VLYVSDLQSNYLNVGELQEKGYILIISKGPNENYDSVIGVNIDVKMS